MMSYVSARGVRLLMWMYILSTMIVGLISEPEIAVAGIVGSKHDFSLMNWSGDKICEPCHTPHHANIDSGAGVPLWNHTLSSASYTLYASATLQRTVGEIQPISKLCLSCHDGTVALDSFGGKTGSVKITGTALLGTDLRDDHPFSIKWGWGFGGRKHGRIVENTTPNRPPKCRNCHNADLTRNDIIPFPNGYVECVSCHDVHNTRGNEKMLNKTLVGSALCLHCHIDK